MEKEQISDHSTPTGKIYEERNIWVGTLLGGPLVGGYMIAKNFKYFGNLNKSKQTWIYTILICIIILGVLLFIPDDVKIPNQIIPLIYASIAYGVTKYFQERKILNYIIVGGKSYNWWQTIGISLLGLVITVILIGCGIVIYNIIFSQAVR